MTSKDAITLDFYNHLYPFFQKYVKYFNIAGYFVALTHANDLYL